MDGRHSDVAGRRDALRWPSRKDSATSDGLLAAPLGCLTATEVSGHDTCNPDRPEVIQAGMNYSPKPHVVISWVLQLTVAGILLQTLFFKFTGAEESVYIFSAVGRFLHLAGVEPWGRIGSGVVELIASLLLLVPATASIGAAADRWA